MVKIQDDELVTYLLCKSADGHQYLHYNSCHPKHFRRSGVPYGAKCIKMICSLEENFERHIEERKVWI